MGSLDDWSGWRDYDTPIQNLSTANDFVAKVERSVYENEPMSDEEVEKECRLWAQRFPHLRVIGKGIVPKRTDDDQEAIRTAIVRNVVKNYLWNSVVEAIENEVKDCKRRDSMRTSASTRDGLKPKKKCIKLPTISPNTKNSSSKVTLKTKDTNK